LNIHDILKMEEGNLEVWLRDILLVVQNILLVVQNILLVERNYKLVEQKHYKVENKEELEEKIDMKELDPDYYFSNFHKWGFSTKAACFMYTKKEWQTVIHPVVISFYYNKSYAQEFMYKGTKDCSSWLSVKEAIEFMNHLGPERIISYGRKMAMDGAKLMAKIWDTELLIKDESMACNMVNVLLPFQDGERIDNYMYQWILEKYNTIFLTFKFSNGKYYARVAGQIINEIEDYRKAAEALLDYMNNGK